MAWWSSPRRSRRDLPEGFDPADVAEMEDAFAAVEADQLRAQVVRLMTILHRLVSYRVPARAVEAAPERQAVRVRFADGTQVLVRGCAPGDAGVLACWVRDRRVLLVTCTETDGGAALTFASPERHGQLDFVVTGLDAPG